MMTTPKSTVGNHQGQEKFPVRQQLFPHRGNKYYIMGNFPKGIILITNHVTIQY